MEVKAGASGALRSLHVFMAERGYPWAVRFGGAPPLIPRVKATSPTGHAVSYQLLSVPWYLAEIQPTLVAQVAD